MEPTFIERDEMLIAGMAFHGDPFHGGNGWTEDNEVGRLWSRFSRFWDNHRDSIKHIVDPGKLYEIWIEPRDFKDTNESCLMIGVEISKIDDLPFELSVKSFPAGKYAVFTLKGDTIKTNWADEIFKKWLPNSGYQEAHKYLFEVYDDRFKGLDDLTNSELDVHLPIK
jgi:AraC family transcriptional regulator